MRSEAADGRQPHLFLVCGIQHPQQEDVMAAHSAVRAINSQEITEKARRDLLHLLEGVCKAYEDLSC